MKYLLAMTLLLACALLVLWRDVNATHDAAPAMTRERAADSRAPTPLGLAPAMPVQHAPVTTSGSAAGQATPPPGGLRAWSPTATPIDGPDPFAPVPEVRSAEDTRAGLDE